MNRILLPLLTASALGLLGCDGGSTPSADGKRVLARNVIFSSSSSAQGGDRSAMASATEDVDPNLKVLAQNVEVSNVGNTLAAKNLQSALDDELAVDLATLLPGTTWTIENRTYDEAYGRTGEVTFTKDGQMTLSGYFAAGGMVSGSVEDSNCEIPQEIHYEMLGNSVLYLTTQIKGRCCDGLVPRDFLPFVAAHTKDKIILVGQGGCGGQAVDRVSILTRKKE
jgi:hypothetical protein